MVTRGKLHMAIGKTIRMSHGSAHITCGTLKSTEHAR
jgi:hypothetical protein